MEEKYRSSPFAGTAPFISIRVSIPIKKISKNACNSRKLMIEYTANAFKRFYKCVQKLQILMLYYGRRISSEGKIICKTDLREVQDH